MTIDAWLQAAITDAERRELPELRVLLEALARATGVLRNADFNDDASGENRFRGAQADPRSGIPEEAALRRERLQ